MHQWTTCKARAKLANAAAWCNTVRQQMPHFLLLTVRARPGVAKRVGYDHLDVRQVDLSTLCHPLGHVCAHKAHVRPPCNHVFDDGFLVVSEDDLQGNTKTARGGEEHHSCARCHARYQTTTLAAPTLPEEIHPCGQGTALPSCRTVQGTAPSEDRADWAAGSPAW